MAEPVSINEAARTVEVTWTTGARVRRRGAFGEDFDEELSLDDAAVNLGRLNAGAALLNSHNAQDLSSVVGVVEKAWLQGPKSRREGRATIRFSDRADVEPIWRDLKGGIIRNISVGYEVSRWEKTERKNDVALLRAIDWSPLELSLVPIPADPGAQVRAGNSHGKLNRVTEFAPPTAAGATSPLFSTNDQPNPAALERAVAAERERVRGIGKIARFAGADEREIDELIDRKVPVDTVRAAMSDRRAAAQDYSEVRNIDYDHISVRGGESYDSPSAKADAYEEAMFCRITGKKPSERARHAMNLRTVDIARGVLEANGTRGVRSLSDSRVFDIALSGRRDVGGMLTTSDFQTLLSNVAERVLRDAYDQEASPLKARLSRAASVSDFTGRSFAQISGLPVLPPVREHGEIHRVTRVAEGGGYAVNTHASILALSRNLLVNDRVDAFGDSVTVFGRSAAETENRIFAGLLTANSGAGGVMGDGTTLLHLNHGNVAAVGTVIDATSLSAGRLAMRTFKDIDGTTPISARPAYLLVGPTMETSAQIAVATLAAASTANVNVFAGQLEVLVSNHLPGNRWYLVAGNIPLFEHAYLNGASGPTVTSQEGWNTLGVELRAVLDFGAGLVDHRAIYGNPGPA